MNQPRLQENLRYLRHSALPGVELLVAAPSLHGWRMNHERYLICGCRSVSTSWAYRGKTRHIEDGTTAFMEPGETHRVIAKRKPSHFVALFIEPGPFLKMAQEQGISGAPHFRCAETKDAALLDHLYKLAESIGKRKTGLELESHLAVIMHRALHYTETVLKAVGASGAVPARSLEIAREVLRARYTENVTLEELAAAAAMSRYHLVRRFAEYYGAPPHAYQVQLRVEHACRMLRKGAKCAEVAIATGFADQSHLGRHFKKVMGVTPRQYSRTRAE